MSINLSFQKANVEMKRPPHSIIKARRRIGQLISGKKRIMLFGIYNISYANKNVPFLVVLNLHGMKLIGIKMFHS